MSYEVEIMDEFTMLIIAYIMFCFVVVFPPTEVISAGLTIQNIFGKLLGDEQLHFVQFHIRRTALTIFIHSCLPFFFFVMLEWTYPETDFLSQNQWAISAGIALLFPLFTSALVFYWHQGNWKRHPLMKTLCLYNHNWEEVASAINTEYRRVDKFAVELGGIRRVIVTDSWVLLVSSYKLELSQQADIRLTVVRTSEHAISHHSESQAQFLDILVENVAKPIPPFTLRLNALNYGDLKQKLQRPVDVARDIILHQTLDERFVEAFLEQSSANPRASLPPEERAVLDSCLGCGLTMSNVKLEKNCIDEAEERRDHNDQAIPTCRQCYCRPMWCVACMGRWFASRQDPHHPEDWLRGKSPCPTCRAIFCVLDVAIVE